MSRLSVYFEDTCQGASDSHLSRSQ